MKKFLTAIFFLLFFVNLAFGQAELQKVRIEDFSGGMVSNATPDILAPNQAASAVNVEINRPGKISKRRGQTLFNTDVGSTAFRGLGRFDPDATTSYMIVASSTSVARSLASQTSWLTFNGASNLTSGLDTTFIQADKLLFIVNGFDNPFWYDGANWFAGSNVYPTSPPVTKTGAWLRNYLFLTGNPTEPDWVYVSNNLNPQKFDVADIVKVNTGDGQAVVRVVPYRLNELIAYKDRSIYVVDITGSPPSTCTTDCWTVQPLNKTIGLIAPKSVVQIGNDQWFLSSNPIAIRSLVRSDFDKILQNSVSGVIQDVFDGTGAIAINKTHIAKAASVFFDNKFLIAVPTGTSTVNNTTFVYDFLANGWTRIDGWYPADWLVFDERLFYIDANDGRVLECFTSNYADYAIGPETTPSAPNQAIIMDYLSREIDFDNKENFKQPDAFEVEFEPTGNYYAETFINLDQGGWTSTGAVNLAGNSLTLDFTLPSNIGKDGMARKTFQTQRYGEFKRMQIRVRQNGLNQKCILKRITDFATIKKWRRENNNDDNN